MPKAERGQPVAQQERSHPIPAPNIIAGQRIDAVKLERAKQLRQEMTPEEAILWSCLRAGRLEELRFRRQQVLDGFILDFYCHEAALVVEVDGGIHAEQIEYDKERDAIIAAHELRVLRIKNEEIRQDLPATLRRIAEACRERAGATHRTSHAVPPHSRTTRVRT